MPAFHHPKNSKKSEIQGFRSMAARCSMHSIASLLAKHTWVCGGKVCGGTACVDLPIGESSISPQPRIKDKIELRLGHWCSRSPTIPPFMLIRDDRLIDLFWLIFIWFWFLFYFYFWDHSAVVMFLLTEHLPFTSSLREDSVMAKRPKRLIFLIFQPLPTVQR